MDDFASELRMIGLILMPSGVLNLGIGILMARNPKFQPWLVAALQYASVSLVLAGALYYFQPLGVQTSLHAGTVIYLIAFVAIIWRYRRARDADRGNLPQ
jgi:hypothetical protein